jgi:hypothetical protein
MSWKKCYQKFCKKNPTRTLPHERIMHRTVETFSMTGSVSNKKRQWKQYIPTEEKLDDTGAEIETSSRKVFMLAGCSKWVVKILSSLGNSAFKTTCIEKQSWTAPSSRIGSKELILQVVSRIRSPWTYWPGTHVFLDKT